jgi:Cap4 dsDNA endonuclease
MTSPDTVLDKVDPGADVASRFNYQHCYAAINAIRLITDNPNIAEVICENHEDFLVKKAVGKFIGTQIKTRALTQPPFKSSDGQIKSALTRFCILDTKFPESFDEFDFTTNHTFWTEAESGNNLPWLLSGIRERGGIKGLRAANPLRKFVEEIAAESGLKPTEVAATLQKTFVRAYESDIASIRGHVREALSECPGVSELPYSIVVQIADAIIALARDASMKTLKGPIADLYAPGTDLMKAIDDQQLSGKRISKADVVAIIENFKNNSQPYQDLDLATLITPSDVPSDLVLAVRKLAQGGVETARVTTIKDLVRSFEFLFLRWSRKYGVEEATKRHNNVFGVVQFEAAEAKVHAEKTGEPYGSVMYAILFDRLNNRAKQDSDQLYKCRPEHLLGATGLLTQQCKTWWSSKFDVSKGAI